MGKLIEILDNGENGLRFEGYLPMVDFETWRVAYLTTCQELKAHNLASMQKHDATDEVFILLKGSCILYTGDGGGKEIGHISAILMEPFKLYNIKKSVWHTHSLEEDTLVLIVENQDTGLHNSPVMKLNLIQKELICHLHAREMGTMKQEALT